MQTLYWSPSMDATTFYEVWSSVNNVTFTLLATIPVDTSGINFDSDTNQYFYVDIAASTTWYKVRASDGIDFSPFTIAKQPESADLPTCRIYGRVVGFDGVPVAGTAIAAHVELSAADMSGQFVAVTGILSDNVEAYADENGNWEIDLVQGGVADLEIAAINFEKTFTVPIQDTANLIDLV
jgi:hypothetical protein